MGLGLVAEDLPALEADDLITGLLARIFELLHLVDDEADGRGQCGKAGDDGMSVEKRKGVHGEPGGDDNRLEPDDDERQGLCNRQSAEGYQGPLGDLILLLAAQVPKPLD